MKYNYDNLRLLSGKRIEIAALKTLRTDTDRIAHHAGLAINRLYFTLDDGHVLECIATQTIAMNHFVPDENEIYPYGAPDRRRSGYAVIVQSFADYDFSNGIDCGRIGNGDDLAKRSTGFRNQASASLSLLAGRKVELVQLMADPIPKICWSQIILLVLDDGGIFEFLTTGQFLPVSGAAPGDAFQVYKDNEEAYRLEDMGIANPDYEDPRDRQRGWRVEGGIGRGRDK